MYKVKLKNRMKEGGGRTNGKVKLKKRMKEGGGKRTNSRGVIFKANST